MIMNSAIVLLRSMAVMGQLGMLRLSYGSCNMWTGQSAVATENVQLFVLCARSDITHTRDGD